MPQPFVHQVAEMVEGVQVLDDVRVQMDILETNVKHVCFDSITIILVSYELLFKNYKSKEISVFWNLKKNLEWLNKCSLRPVLV